MEDLFEWLLGLLLQIALIAVPAWVLIGIVVGDWHVMLWPIVARSVFAGITGAWTAYVVYSLLREYR